MPAQQPKKRKPEDEQDMNKRQMAGSKASTDKKEVDDDGEGSAKTENGKDTPNKNNKLDIADDEASQSMGKSKDYSRGGEAEVTGGGGSRRGEQEGVGRGTQTLGDLV
ncbi:uncharacterized protein LOC142344097 isoform X1 [Convolutriloba macropyga]|uniref:uncharacterized protein LOC142344097 isoform X1 n=1 Tax=Convolutriloba macropyga TaxID=536237 RepID=UPI003F51C8F6